MGMTLKELLTKGEGTLTAGEAKTCLLYTSLTTEEAKQLEEAKDSGFVDAEEIDWSKIGHE